MAEEPLEGRRIVVTRPREQAAPLAEELERLGATVLTVPLIRIEPVADPRPIEEELQHLVSYDWIVLTSANSVTAIRPLLAGMGGALPTVKVAAVGPATAAAVRALGVEPAYVPDRYSGEDLAAGLGTLEGARVLLPRADSASDRVVDMLRAGGAEVTALDTYVTVPNEPAEADIAQLEEGFDALVLASGSAARSLEALRKASPGVRDALGTSLVVCIGPKTAEAARDVGLPVGLVAREATAEGIIQALTSHFRELR